ncbi:MAG TPA: hypothetical protein VLJ83_01155 [Gemmatimonadaceae bacterium]|nr:hypothetical protein [Gemmatimonadaceae bacterium]
MNCSECLEELATRSLREIPSDSAVMRHCATCPDCARLTTQLREREYDTASILNNLPPMTSSTGVAETAVALSHRRRVGRVVVVLSGVASALIIWAVAATMIFPAMFRSGVMGSPVGGLHTETIRLACLSAEQAADIIHPYVRSRGSTYYTPRSGIHAITVRGTSIEIARAQELIGEFENDARAGCHVDLGSQLRELEGALDGAVAGARAATQAAAAAKDLGGAAARPVIAGTAADKK